jgi:hypothetical protein
LWSISIPFYGLDTLITTVYEAVKFGIGNGAELMAASVLAAVSALVVFGFVLYLLSRGVLKEKYAVLWLVVTGGAFFFSLFPAALKWISDSLGVTIPSNLVFFVTLVILVLVNIQLSFELSRHEARLRRLAEESALLSERMRRLEEPDDSQ